MIIELDTSCKQILPIFNCIKNEIVDTHEFRAHIKFIQNVLISYSSHHTIFSNNSFRRHLKFNIHISTTNIKI